MEVGVYSVSELIETGVIPDAVLNAWWVAIDARGRDTLPVATLPDVEGHEPAVELVRSVGRLKHESVSKEQLGGVGLRLMVTFYKDTGKFYDRTVLVVPEGKESESLAELVVRYQRALCKGALANLDVIVEDTPGNLMTSGFRGFHFRRLVRESILAALKSKDL